MRGGIHCTSSMKVEIQNDEHITVQYYPAHYGHSNLSSADDLNVSDNSMTIPGVSMHHHQHQTPQHHDNSHHGGGGDRSSSSSPGSSSTSPSGGSNSNSNHPPAIHERQSITTSNPYMNSNYIIHTNHHHQQQQQPQQHFHINTNHYQQQQQQQQHHHVQQQQQQHQHAMQHQMSQCLVITPSLVVDDSPLLHSNSHPTSVLVVQQNLPTSSLNSQLKKEKCVSDIMHEAFQLLSYWPLDHHHGIITSENEQILPHSRLNMEEHLMF